MFLWFSFFRFFLCLFWITHCLINISLDIIIYLYMFTFLCLNWYLFLLSLLFSLFSWLLFDLIIIIVLFLLLLFYLLLMFGSRLNWFWFKVVIIVINGWFQWFFIKLLFLGLIILSLIFCVSYHWVQSHFFHCNLLTLIHIFLLLHCISQHRAIVK